MSFRINGHVGEARAVATADQAQRRAAERAPGSIILTKNDVQGEWHIEAECQTRPSDRVKELK